MLPSEIRIPEDQRSTLKAMVGLSGESRSSISKAIAATPPTLLGRSFAIEIEKRVAISGIDVSEVVRVLFSLYISMDRYAEPVEPFVGSVIAALEKDNILSADAASNEFRSWLCEVLAYDSTLGVSAKALEVYAAFPHNYCRARIITDFRPVFRHDPKNGPATGMIVHQAQIAYHENDSEEETTFYVTLDRADLVQVQEIVRRALAKEDSLKSTLQKGGLTVLGS